MSASMIKAFCSLCRHVYTEPNLTSRRCRFAERPEAGMACRRPRRRHLAAAHGAFSCASLALFLSVARRSAAVENFLQAYFLTRREGRMVCLLFWAMD